MRQLFQPRYLFIAGIAMLVTSQVVQYYTRQEGLVLLEAGKPRRILAEDNAVDTANVKSGGMTLTLDSVRIETHTPEFELLSWYQKAPDNPHQAPSPFAADEPPAARYATELMKIYKIGDTDFHFRMKAFYPDFAFAYTYPQNRDTLKPIAPGVTLRLQSPEGSPIVTLGMTKPYRQTLDDMVGLGATLEYYWSVDTDSLREVLRKAVKPKVILLGAINSVWFVRGDSMVTDTLRENQFYPTMSNDSIGFNVLIAFPDAAYLKAEPSTASDQLRNPVAGVEIWKEGGAATEAYLYPESAGKKGGRFAVSGTGYTLGMGYKKEVRVRHCTCDLQVQAPGLEDKRQITLQGNGKKNILGYRLALDDCYSQAQAVSLSITAQKGRFWMFAGAFLLIVAAMMTFIGRMKSAL